MQDKFPEFLLVLDQLYFQAHSTLFRCSVDPGKFKCIDDEVLNEVQIQVMLSKLEEREHQLRAQLVDFEASFGKLLVHRFSHAAKTFKETTKKLKELVAVSKEPW